MGCIIFWLCLICGWVFWWVQVLVWLGIFWLFTVTNNSERMKTFHINHACKNLAASCIFVGINVDGCTAPLKEAPSMGATLVWKTCFYGTPPNLIEGNPTSSKGEGSPPPLHWWKPCIIYGSPTIAGSPLHTCRWKPPLRPSASTHNESSAALQHRLVLRPEGHRTMKQANSL